MGIVTLVIASFFGLTIGSFANVLIYRIPRQEDIVFDRSKCMHCSYQLQWYDLLPVLSYLFLGGKCRQCKAKISYQYILVELVSGLLFFLTFYLFPDVVPIHLVFKALIIEAFFVLAVIDFKHLLLPDGIQIFIAVFGLTTLLWRQVGFVWSVSWMQHIITALVFGGILFGIWYLSKGEWLGFGDVKLMALIGLLFGPLPSITIFYGAVFVGILIGVYLLSTRKGNMKTAIPFGTLLCIMAIVALLYPQGIHSAVDAFLRLI